MKLYELVEALENQEKISFEVVAPYKKSIYTYFKQLFGEEPIALIVDVTNTGACVIVSPPDKVIETIDDYLAQDEILTEEDKKEIKETILFQSRPLKDL